MQSSEREGTNRVLGARSSFAWLLGVSVKNRHGGGAPGNGGWCGFVWVGRRAFIKAFEARRAVFSGGSGSAIRMACDIERRRVASSVGKFRRFPMPRPRRKRVRRRRTAGAILAGAATGDGAERRQSPLPARDFFSCFLLFFFLARWRVNLGGFSSVYKSSLWPLEIPGIDDFRAAGWLGRELPGFDLRVPRSTKERGDGPRDDDAGKNGRPSFCSSGEGIGLDWRRPHQEGRSRNISPSLARTSAGRRKAR